MPVLITVRDAARTPVDGMTAPRAEKAVLSVWTDMSGPGSFIAQHLGSSFRTRRRLGFLVIAHSHS